MADSLDIDLARSGKRSPRSRRTRAFRDFLGDTRLEDLRLLVSELVAEAVGGFGKSKDHLIRLRAERDGDTVRASGGLTARRLLTAAAAG